MSKKNNNTLVKNDGNLAEDVLRDAGKSEDEVKRTGAIDRADSATDELYGERGRTTGSPVHRVVWSKAGVRHFLPGQSQVDPQVEETVARSIAALKANKAAGTAYDENGKVSKKSIADLGAAGYWGMLIDKKYGGQGASLNRFTRMITEVAAAGFPTEAGMSSIHGCIGAVDPVSVFGTDEQKARFLPGLASGQRISAFALTEPGAGSDLTALKTVARLEGDEYVINGEKLFISNAIPGRTIGLVTRVEGEEKPAVFIVELPETENQHFQIVHYGIHALRHANNNGLKFVNFRVPAANRLSAPDGNGLVIAYHGLNYGRVALCANAAGVMRLLLRSICPESWGKYRVTFTQPIETRELVKKRIARLAGLIVGADALREWCSSKLDEGYRGELECIIAKIFGSTAQKEAAIDIAMTTHGGRSFLHGHLVGDNIHDYLAPLIYEGEGEMLAMKFFLSLATEHGKNYMLPLGNGMKALTKGKVFSGAWQLMKYGVPFAFWNISTYLKSFFSGQSVSGMNRRLQKHVNFALKQSTKLALEISTNMVKHQVKLGDRQARIVHMSQRVQDTLVMLVTAMYAHSKGDEATIAAADVLCQDLRRKLTGEQPSDAYFRDCNKLADMVIEGKFTQIAGVEETPVLRGYQK
jgi:alkylation response protein AidB-like acyl-CoA dehydrogenase